MKPSSIVGSLQKQIPKKPPPPTPADVIAATAQQSDQQQNQHSQLANNNGHNNNNNINNNNNNNNNNGLHHLAATNNSSSTSSLATLNDQKPALPPRPVNQFNPILQQQHSQSSYIASALASKPSLLNHLQQHSLQSTASPVSSPSQQQVQPVREQARVVYAYKPGNEDELAMEVGDIINVLDKEIEDAGWWKGELNGNIGVFPDNFVELITTPIPPVPGTAGLMSNNNNSGNNTNSNHTNNNNSIPITNNSNNVTPTTASATSNAASTIPSTASETPTSASFTMAMMKSKLEENLNLEKQYLNNNAFYSLKRNKMQQQMSLPSEPTSSSTPNVTSTTNNTTSVSNMTESNERFRDIISNINDNSDPSTKLNHITANRPKGPNRRPPTDFMKMRHQSEADHLHHQSQPHTFAPANQLPHLAQLPATSHLQQQQQQPQQPQQQHHHQHNHQAPVSQPQITPPSHASQQIPTLTSHQQQTQVPQQVSLASFNELKTVVEQLRIELRETRSEMDHHKRYIKEIVSILADERKKFTAIDQGLNRSF